MKKVAQRTVSVSAFIIAIMLSFFSLYLFLKYDRWVNVTYFIGIVITISISALIGVNSLHNQRHRKRNLTYMWYFIFTLYIILLVYLLFFSGRFARDQISLDDLYINALKMQWNQNVNVVPFKTISSMMSSLQYQFGFKELFLMNVVGNFIAFMPFAFFSSLLWKRMRKTIRFMIWTSVVIIGVEFIQFFTLCGSMDIDDYILNFSGALFIYLILKMPFCKKTLQRIRGN